MYPRDVGGLVNPAQRVCEGLEPRGDEELKHDRGEHDAEEQEHPGRHPGAPPTDSHGALGPRRASPHRGAVRPVPLAGAVSAKPP